MLRQSPPGDELDGAEGIRYLSRLVRAGFEQFFEAACSDAPRIEPMFAARTSVAQRNPDQIYLRALISGEREYRLTGTRGSGGALSFVTRSTGQRGAEEGITGFLDDRELTCEPDGTFEIVMSTRKHPGNWLPMAPSSDSLMIRELFGDPDGAVPSVVSIERLDGPPSEPPLTVDRVVTALDHTAGTIRMLLTRFGEWTVRCAEQPNRLWTKEDLLGAGEVVRVGGSPGIDYCLGYWSIAPGEGLLIDIRPEPGDRWAFQLMNYWQENLNLPWSTANLNDATARPEADGSVRLLVASTDPGSANWIDTDAHDHGVMLFRWFGQNIERPLPTVAVVKLADVASDAAGGAERRRSLVAPGYRSPRIG